MKRFALTLKVLVPSALLASSCGLKEKAAELSENASVLESEYEAFDLTCSFDDVTADNDAEKSTGAALADTEDSSTCEDAEEQYSVLVEKFDADGDGELSSDELADAESGWDDAKVAAMDSDGDGSVSDAEKQTWKDEKRPARKEKLKEWFNEACETLGKPTDECKGMRGVRMGQREDELKDRIGEFDLDKDGKLSDDERKKMRDALQLERKDRKDKFKSQHDKDGDGKIGPAERQEQHDNRAASQQQNRPPQPGLPPPGGTQSPKPMP